MKNMYRKLLLLSFMGLWGIALVAQPTCDSAVVIIQDDFESYDLGALGPQADHWTTWSGNEGGDEDGLVVSTASASGLQSIFFQGTAGGGPQDVILNLGDHDSGMYILSWRMLIPDQAKGYFNLQRTTTPGEEFPVEVLFDGSQQLGALFLNDDQVLFSFSTDEWFEVRFTIDTDNDVVTAFIAGSFVYSWPLSLTSTGTGQLGAAFGAVDFYPIDDTHFFWVDDIYFAEIPPAEEGKYCYMATPIDTGIHTIDGIDCFGAGFTVRSEGQGMGGRWFSWTAPDDGILTLSSCGMGSDTRVWIFSGGCSTLQIEGVNDDLCSLNPSGGGSEWASYRQALVSAGETYLICWDNVWEGDAAFDFELSFTTDDPAPGDFCESAIAVNAGDTITIDEINGYSSVAGPIIGHFGASTTPYDQSEWYYFTAPANGMMSISSCDFTTEDTRLWVYVGECGLTSLQLVAASDDDCGDFQSLVDSMQVEGGTTYYIEWDSEDLNAPGFSWTLQFDLEVNTEEASLFSKGFRLSPNPASDRVLVNYELPEAVDLEIRILSVAGMEVRRYAVQPSAQGQVELSLAGLNAGLYFVQITDGTHSMVEKLIVE